MWPTEALEQVRLLIFGGEACPPELAARLVADGRAVWNTYGPTEATVVATAARLDGVSPVLIEVLDRMATLLKDPLHRTVRPMRRHSLRRHSCLLYTSRCV